MNPADPILDYAAPSKSKRRPLYPLAAASLILPLVYFGVADFLGFEPDSLAFDSFLGISSTWAFPVKMCLFALFPATFIAMAVISIRRILRRPKFTGIPIACCAITLSLWLLSCDFSKLIALYRGYF